MNRFIGERIRKAREQFAISQKSLGEYVGISDKAISTYESGRTLPPLDILFKISETLRKPVWYFLYEEEDQIAIYDRIEKTQELMREIDSQLSYLKKYIEEKDSSALTPPNTPV